MPEREINILQLERFLTASAFETALIPALDISGEDKILHKSDSLQGAVIGHLYRRDPYLLDTTIWQNHTHGSKQLPINLSQLNIQRQPTQGFGVLSP